MLSNNRLKCWGKGLDGRTGLGFQTDVGLDAAQMGDALPYVDLGTNRQVPATTSQLGFLGLVLW